MFLSSPAFFEALNPCKIELISWNYSSTISSTVALLLRSRSVHEIFSAQDETNKSFLGKGSSRFALITQISYFCELSAENTKNPTSRIMSFAASHQSLSLRIYEGSSSLLRIFSRCFGPTLATALFHVAED